MAEGYRDAFRTADRRLAGAMKPFTGWGKLSLTVTIVLSVFATLGLASVLHVPTVPKYSPSLLSEPSPVIAVLAAAAVVAVCALIGTLFSGRAHYDAGLFAAGIGLTTLSVRGGPIGAALRAADSGPGSYLTLFAEALLLWGLLMGAWAALRAMRGSATLRDDLLGDAPGTTGPLPDQPGTSRDKLLAAVTHVAVMLLLLLLLARGDSKKQMVLATGVAAFAASMMSRAFFPVRGSVWFWSGPLVVALIGYGRAAMDPGAWDLGVPAGPLSTPVPLDYAGAGVAGALMGYWTSRRWQHDREYHAAEAKAAPAPDAVTTTKTT